jgi:hypothetical protein
LTRAGSPFYGARVRRSRLVRRRVLFAALASLASLPVLHGQRERVLKQIDVPHDYYYREMYLPQATSGPSSVAWSPDGRDVVFSQQGFLWRHRLGSKSADQLIRLPAGLVP